MGECTGKKLEVEKDRALLVSSRGSAAPEDNCRRLFRCCRRLARGTVGDIEVEVVSECRLPWSSEEMLEIEIRERGRVRVDWVKRFVCAELVAGLVSACMLGRLPCVKMTAAASEFFRVLAFKALAGFVPESQEVDS